jgi:hypothetical protein
MTLQKLIRWANNKHRSVARRRAWALQEFLRRTTFIKPFRCALPLKKQRELGLIKTL